MESSCRSTTSANCVETFARLLGSGSLMKISRGLNRIWQEGDLQ